MKILTATANGWYVLAKMTGDIEMGGSWAKALGKHFEGINSSLA